LGYCRALVTRPTDTIVVLITDLYEGGDPQVMLTRAAELVRSGAIVVCLLALSDEGTPSYHHDHAARFAALGIPAFACTPDLFPDLMGAAIQRCDISRWAAQEGITASRPKG